MLSLVHLLVSSALVTAAPYHQQHRHVSPVGLSGTESLVTRTTKSNLGTLERMTTAEVQEICHVCWNGAVEWPLPDTPNPVIESNSEQLSLFDRPASTPNTLTVHNYCTYPLYFNHYHQADSLETGTLTAGQTINRPLAGTVLKVYKTKDMVKDVLVEYGIDSQNTMWYDLSLITCLGTTNGLSNSDTSACAGHEAGLQLGNSGEMSFQCAGGAWCDDQVYLYKENLCKKLNPVYGGTPSQGLTMEFCAELKPKSS
ncbi:hypothetical protein EJ02DRAFT_512421 [Clathrospora elynae]|uniref:Uncharacterized protein n=1 Tax=Clathrospora elynae TaxID=706981 RepID=A0A6A5SLK2_9PLEO|nr:hypothetical protein EJ02DRAFT_512421 [Clathrospora elynae]